MTIKKLVVAVQSNARQDEIIIIVPYCSNATLGPHLCEAETVHEIWVILVTSNKKAGPAREEILSMAERSLFRDVMK